jgi:bifunctional non-homologous end joining protein LigD
MTKLKEYNQKRNFKQTDEPAGVLSDKNAQKNKLSDKNAQKNKLPNKNIQEKKLCFVVQHHIARRDHYDLRLEWKGVLLSWAVPKGPSFNPKDKRLAVQVEDHPFEYRNFEGTIPKDQYGGGTVMLWDKGEWEPHFDINKGFDDVDKGLDDGMLKFSLNGKRLKGKWVLTKLKSREGEKNNWLLIKENDEYAKVIDGISQFKTSIKTNRTMDEISNNSFKNKKISKNNTKMADVSEELKKLLKIKGNDYSVGKIKISNHDKIVFNKPKLRKIDVVLYYAYVAKYMLPYISGRVLTVVRCPKGIESECFFKKHPNESSKKVETLQILSEKEDKRADKEDDQGNDEYFYVKNVSGIIAEAQMGTLEFHVWGSHIKNLEKPDIMVFDLDPSEKLSIKKLRQGVRDLKSILDELSLVSFLKTSGGKGYHVVVPFKPSVNWETFHSFARQVAEVMELKWPERYTSNVRKQNRKGKIFIDWARNGRGATSVAPYSIRARKGAPISAPISWDELDTIAPNSIKIKEIYQRIGKYDPWEAFFKTNQKLNR